MRKYAQPLKTLAHQCYLEVTRDFTPPDSREKQLLDFTLAPYYAERFLSFGTVLCFDAFLYTATIIPLRAICGPLSRGKRSWPDICTFLIILIVYLLLCTVNISRVYLAVRSQAGLTIFVIYSFTDVVDKFLSSVGYEIHNCLVNKQTISSKRRSIIYASTALVYTALHAFTLLWQIVTINLAINSYSNALLSFILTNLFGKMKRVVFKRYQPHSLFQVICADVAQRFQLAVIMAILVLRQVLDQIKNKQFSLVSLVGVCGPPLLVLAVDVVVDWMKYSYIVNFNNMDPKIVFTQFLETLKMDYASHFKLGIKSMLIKQIGLPVIPLLIVCTRMFSKGRTTGVAQGPLLFFALLILQGIVGNKLYKYTKTDEPIIDESRESKIDRNLTPVNSPRRKLHNI